MIEVSEVMTDKPSEFSTPLQETIYKTLERLNIPFTRVVNSPSHTMEDAIAINERLGGQMAKNLLLCNRQRTKFYLLVMPGDKPFVTRDFSASLSISRVSFAPEEDLKLLLGVELGATNVMCKLLPQAADVTLVIDRDVLRRPDFMLPDGTVTCHLKIATADLTDKILPLIGPYALINND